MNKQTYEIKQELIRLGVEPQKLRGQNFLQDDTFITKIIDFAESEYLNQGRTNSLNTRGEILEIGPGLGVLTKRLLKHFNNLLAIEIEKDFCRYLESKFPKSEYENFQIINSDIREVNLATTPRLLANSTTRQNSAQNCTMQDNQKYHIFGNIPYSISSDLINWLIINSTYFFQAVFLMQKEFVERLASPHKSRSYGFLSVLTQIHFETELGATIDGDKFYPTTKVTSQLIKLTPKTSPEQLEIRQLADENFLKFVKSCFNSKRKTLINSLWDAQVCDDKSKIKKFVESKYSINIRAEEISPSEFLVLYHDYLSFMKEELSPAI